jgi:hypothetical protein
LYLIEQLFFLALKACRCFLYYRVTNVTAPIMRCKRLVLTRVNRFDHKSMINHENFSTKKRNIKLDKICCTVFRTPKYLKLKLTDSRFQSLLFTFSPWMGVNFLFFDNKDNIFISELHWSLIANNRFFFHFI